MGLFSRITFMGASVTAFNSSVGWNEQASQLTVELVEDPVNGDHFTPLPKGTPVYFQFGAFKFFGLLQRAEKKNSSSGSPTYEVVVTDPRELLAGAPVVVRDYNGPVNACANLFNAYGWWEDPNNGGFGAAQVNESGMPWFLVLQAITQMANTPSGSDYGGPLSLKGFQYNLDLSGLPIPPDYYRVGTTDSLMTLISQLCEDAGCDYFVDLVGLTIRVRTVSRYNQPPLGTLDQMLATADWTGTVVSSKVGSELRNEISSAFLVGGEQTILYQADETSIQPFWGLDVNGFPILGTGVGDTHTMNLNATPVADIVGGLSYTCSVGEMRCALANMDTWAAYMASQRQQFARQLGIIGPYSVPQGQSTTQYEDLLDDAPSNAIALAQMSIVELSLGMRQQRLWQFVRQMAEQYLGKRYIVSIPFALVKQVPDTLQIVWSVEPTEAGYLPEGSQPLGLDPVYEESFSNQDGRFSGFVFIPSNPLINLPELLQVAPNDVVIQPNGIYLRCELDPHILLTPAPAVVLTLRTPVYQIWFDVNGNLSNLTQVLGTDYDDMLEATQNLSAGSTPMRLWPNHYDPLWAALPLKSNISCYGPWFMSGPPGKVRYEYDPSLTPWGCGDWDTMNNIALARVQQATTLMQEGESGSIEVVGAPNWSLGDVLQANGPTLTNVHVQYGKQGVTTTYEWRTWTPKFGVLAKANADRMRRLGGTALQLRKTIRNIIRMQEFASFAVGAATQGAAFNEAMNRSFRDVGRDEAPYPVFAGTVTPGPSGGPTRYGVSSMTAGQALVAAQPHDPSGYQRTAVMSFAGLIRPISTFSGDQYLGHLTTPSGSFANAITGTNYNPFQAGNDIELLAWGQSYTGMRKNRQPDPNYTRAMGLRAPLLLTGWGMGIDGMAYPSGSSNQYMSGYLSRGETWPTAPVDLLYDKWRNVWTCHDGYVMYLPAGQTIPAGGGPVSCQVWDGSVDTGIRLPVYNWFSSAITASNGNLKMMCMYAAHANKIYVVATDC